MGGMIVTKGYAKENDKGDWIAIFDDIEIPIPKSQKRKIGIILNKEKKTGEKFYIDELKLWEGED